MRSEQIHAVARQSIYSCLNTVVLQGAAILALPPKDYGVFSLFYLAFALASSVTYSAVSDAWARSPRDGDSLQSWPRYCTALSAVAAASLVIVVVVGCIAGMPGIALLLGGAVSLSTYRLGARYYSAALGRLKKVGAADIVGAIVMIPLFLALKPVLPKLEALSAAWLVSATVSATMSERPRFDFRFGLGGWIRTHKSSIRTLLIDSSLMDLGSIGVPLLLAPLLGVTKFGVYRGVSSAAMPVRIVLNPMRPNLARVDVRQFARTRILLSTVMVGLLVAAGCSLVLRVMRSQEWLTTSVLHELGNYSVPVGLFVGSNIVGMFYYLVARSHLNARRILLYRGAQLISAVALPIAGFVAGDLMGAIWGYTLAGLINGAVVMFLVRAEGKQRDSATSLSIGAPELSHPRTWPWTEARRIRNILDRYLAVGTNAIQRLRGQDRVSSDTRTVSLLLPASHGSMGDDAMRAGVAAGVEAIGVPIKIWAPGAIREWPSDTRIGSIHSLGPLRVGQSGLLTRDACRVFSDSAVIVIGADTISGDYLHGDLAYRVAVLRHAVRSGNRALLVNFSFAENPTMTALHLLRSLPREVELWARDDISRERAARMLSREVLVAPDVAALAEVIATDRARALTTRLENPGYIGFSPNAHLETLGWFSRRALVSFWVNLSLQFLDDYEVVLLPHDIRRRPGDTGLAEEICRGILLESGRKAAVFVPGSAGEAKYVLGSAKGVVSGRLHACVGALASGVPTVGLEYLGKFVGQFKWFGETGRVLPLESSVDVEAAANALRTLMALRSVSGVNSISIDSIGWLRLSPIPAAPFARTSIS